MCEEGEKPSPHLLMSHVLIEAFVKPLEEREFPNRPSYGLDVAFRMENGVKLVFSFPG